MTQAEFDKQDEQVIGMANRETKQGKAAESMKVSAHTVSAEGVGQCDNRSMAEKMRRHLWAGLRVAICALVAVLFVIALMDETFVVHLANLGILSCGITAAIIIDRHIRKVTK